MLFVGVGHEQVYTETISVGVSCSEARFTHLFAFFLATHQAAKQAGQMCFRSHLSHACFFV